MHPAPPNLGETPAIAYNLASPGRAPPEGAAWLRLFSVTGGSLFIMPTGSTATAKQIGDMGKLAADIKALLSSQKDVLSRAGLGFPPGLMDGLAGLRDGLERVRPAVENMEAEIGRLRALADTSSVINSSLDLTTVLNQVMDTIVRLTGAERGFMMLTNEKGELEFRIARNVDSETLDSSAFHVSRTILTQVAESGEPVVTTNAQADPRFSAQESVVGYNLRSIVCVPLKFKGAITGVIYVDNRIRTGLFTESERDLLAAFANQAAIAIENARQFQQVSELKNLLDNVFASIASGVITTDVEDLITLCNRSSETILGNTAAHIVGQPLLRAMPGLDESSTAMLRRVKLDQRGVGGRGWTPPLARPYSRRLTLNTSPLQNCHQARPS